jgi:hypothetical protein
LRTATDTNGDLGTGLVLALFREQEREVPWVEVEGRLRELARRDYVKAILLWRRGHRDLPAQPRVIRRDRRAGRPSLISLLLPAASACPQPFTVADLTVAAFAAHPDRFALVGHPGYPDSNRVAAVLLCRCGPLRQGDVQRVGANLYRVTPQGREKAQ